MVKLTSIALTISVALALPPSAQGTDVTVGLRLGDSFIAAGKGGVKARIVIGGGQRAYRNYVPGTVRDRRVFVPVFVRERVHEVPVEPPPPEPVQTKSAPEKVVTRTEPPDPSGSSRLVRARDRAAPYQPGVGDLLPVHVPVVLLDHRHFALPEPGPGETYVRFRQDVYLIEPRTRRVLAGPDICSGEECPPRGS